jgi:hypothetical protein
VYGGVSESGVESDANANTARAKFVTYLDATTSDYFLAVASYDAIGLDDAMVVKLREFGLGELDYTAVSGVDGFRTPFAFLGYKGLQQGYALYQLHGEGENEPYAEVMAYVSNGIFMSSKDGKDGLPGNDAYTVKIEPANIIFTQSTTKNSNGVYPLEPSYQTSTVIVKKGNSDSYVNHSVSIQSMSGCSASNRGDNITVTGSTGYTEGSVTVHVTITNGPTFDLKLNVYYNLLGSWKETVVGDTKTEVAQKIKYAINDTTGQVDGY